MNRIPNRRRSFASAALLVGLSCAAYLVATPDVGAATPTFPNVVVPAPVSETADGTTFTLSSGAAIATDVADVGTYLAGILRTSTGFALPVSQGGTATITL